jgi:hypothetical protein
MWDENIERIKRKKWFGHNYESEDDIYFASNSNTFKKNRKNGEYLYFYVEDAIRMAQQIHDEVCSYDLHEPHVAEFDIATDILAEYLGLGIYKNTYGRNLSNDEYYISLEFSIPYKVIADNYFSDNWRCSCITDRMYFVPYFKHFEEASIPADLCRKSYETFSKIELPIVMKMLNVGILPPDHNCEMKDRYGFSKLADAYSKDEAVKILTRLDR